MHGIPAFYNKQVIRNLNKDMHIFIIREKCLKYFSISSCHIVMRAKVKTVKFRSKEIWSVCFPSVHHNQYLLFITSNPLIIHEVFNQMQSFRVIARTCSFKDNRLSHLDFTPCLYRDPLKDLILAQLFFLSASSTALWTAVNLVNIILRFFILHSEILCDNKYHHMKKIH